MRRAAALAMVLAGATTLPRALAAEPTAPLPPRAGAAQPVRPPAPVKAVPPAAQKAAAAPKAPKIDTAAAAAARARSVAGVSSFAYQLVGLDIEEAARSPFDLIILDATTGLGSGRPLTAADVERLKRKPDGSRRLVLSYLSIGEAEDYRPDYFTTEYMTEDAPDWLMNENPQWKGNRIIRFCKEGWQRTVLGDDDGRSLYNSIEPSPLYRLVELGLDGVALDRVDVYSEVTKECPNARATMVDFVARLAAHARKRNPQFLVLLHNAEELLSDGKMIGAIDAAVKEDLFYGTAKGGGANSEDYVKSAIAALRNAKAAGRPVLVIDYVKDRARIAEARRRTEAEGFIAYYGPRKLDSLWLPGVNF